MNTGVKRRPWTAAEDATLRQAYADGRLNAFAVAKQTGRSLHAVYCRGWYLNIQQTRTPREPDIDSGAFADALLYYRQRAGLTQSELGRVAIAHPSYIGRLESAERDHPTREMTLAIARALHLTTTETDEFLTVAGHCPNWLLKLGANDSTLTSLVDVLTNDRLSPAKRAELRACIEVMCATWLATVPGRAAERREA